MNFTTPINSSWEEDFSNQTLEDISLYPCDSYLNKLERNEVELDVDTYLELCMAAKRHPYKVLIPLTIIHIIMFVTGIFGNFIVCYIIVKNPGMHTSTNFFLFSLAIADITILAVGLPNDLYVYWQQYPWIFGTGLCKIRALVSEMTSYSSVLTIVAFSMERYLAICHPLYSYTMSGLRRASKIIAAVWIIALVAAIPYAVFTKIHYVPHPHTNEDIVESAFCTVGNPTPTFLFESSFLLFFLIPMTIMIFLYVRMGLRIRKTATFGKNTAVHGESKQAQSKRAILKMLAAVVLAFFICWAPFHAQRLMIVFYYEYEWKFVSDEVYRQINEKLFYITGCFYYFSSTVNPILYNVLSVKYRNAFKETLCGKASSDVGGFNNVVGGHTRGVNSTATFENGHYLSVGNGIRKNSTTTHLRRPSFSSEMPVNGRKSRSRSFLTTTTTMDGPSMQLRVFSSATATASTSTSASASGSGNGKSKEYTIMEAPTLDIRMEMDTRVEMHPVSSNDQDLGGSASSPPSSSGACRSGKSSHHRGLKGLSLGSLASSLSGGGKASTTEHSNGGDSSTSSITEDKLIRGHADSRGGKLT